MSPRATQTVGHNVRARTHTHTLSTHQQHDDHHDHDDGARSSSSYGSGGTSSALKNQNWPISSSDSATPNLQPYSSGGLSVASSLKELLGSTGDAHP